MKGKRGKTKDSFVGARFETKLARKLLLLSVLAGEPGNKSAGLRWAVENAPTGSQQPEREPAHA